MGGPFVLTFDVEHAVEANYGGYTRIAPTPDDDAALRRQVAVLLRACIAHRVGATFFVLGTALDAFCRAWEDVSPRSEHRLEVAFHAPDHRALDDWEPAEFARGTEAFQRALGSRLGLSAKGFRAPSWSLSKTNVNWVYRALEEAGFVYSSSEFRIRAKLFPQVSASSLPFVTAEGLIEIPVNPAHYLGVTIPYNGGGWARFFPVSLLLAVLGAEEFQPHPKVFFLHPREIDPASRILPLSPFHSFLHHHGIEDMPGKLDVLLASFRWRGMLESLAPMRPAPLSQRISGEH